MDWIDLFNPKDDPVPDRESRLAFALVQLQAFRAAPLSAEFLTGLETGLARVRAAGEKLVLRFAYNDDGGADAPRPIVLGHIAQLGPIVSRNRDVIAVLQAGFIGAWGEWHHSTNHLDNDVDRRAVFEAELLAFPSDRQIEVRTPMFKSAIAGGPVTIATAFTDMPVARAAHHNDCLLAPDDDEGTYAKPVDRWRRFAADDSEFLAAGGETCAKNPPHTDCEESLAELGRLHYVHLNRVFKEDVIAGWKKQGCWDQIRDRLGYRLVLRRAGITPKIAPGGVLELDVTVENTGFARPMNKRAVWAVVTSGGITQKVVLPGVDARRFGPGEVTHIGVRLRLPATQTIGACRVALWLPDEAESLRGRPAYAVRFANEGVWDELRGDNVLASDIVIDPLTGGDVDRNSASLAVIR